MVGRVLAAGKNATECMGWVSSEVLPRGVGESWVDIEVERPPPTGRDKPKNARIWKKEKIEHDGSVIGGADASSILPGDFISPSEDTGSQHYMHALAIKLESLDLFTIGDSVATTPTRETSTPSEASVPGVKSCSAMMRFIVDVDGGVSKELNFELKHDVYFVTAHPCVSSPNTEISKSPTSPSFHSSPPQSQTASTRDFKGHPLHKGFTYATIPILNLLTSPRDYSFDSLLLPSQSPTTATAGPATDPAQSSTHTTDSRIPKVLVIDCTDETAVAFPTRPSPSPHLGSSKHKFGSDMEMMARALCAERGWNALVSRRGRGCLACSIREASALGWRVVLRFA